LSSRPKRSVVEGPAVSFLGRTKDSIPPPTKNPQHMRSTI
jgi:hypothetical protein